MEQKFLDIKLRVPENGLYPLLLQRIKECGERNEQIVKFPKVFSKLAVSFSIPKSRVWELLYFLNDMGLIEIVYGHGIRIICEINKGKNEE